MEDKNPKIVKFFQVLPELKEWIEGTSLFHAIREHSREDFPCTIVSAEITINISSDIIVEVAEDLPVEVVEEFFKNSPYYHPDYIGRFMEADGQPLQYYLRFKADNQ